MLDAAYRSLSSLIKIISQNPYLYKLILQLIKGLFLSLPNIQMLGRRLLHAFAKSKSKTSPHVITSDSNMIVDHLAFTHTDFMSRIMNWIRNSNASS